MADNIKKITETDKVDKLQDSDLIPLVRTGDDGVGSVVHAVATQFKGDNFTYDDMTEAQISDLAARINEGSLSAEVTGTMTDDTTSTTEVQKMQVKNNKGIGYPLTHAELVKMSSTKTLAQSMKEVQTSVAGKQDKLVSGASIATVNGHDLLTEKAVTIEGMTEEQKSNLEDLMNTTFPTKMDVGNNSSTSTVDKMRMVVYRTIGSKTSYPSTSITGTRVLTPYNGSSTTTQIATADLGTSGNYKTYEHAAEYGKAVHTFKDATSGKSGSYTARHARTCYMWFGTSNTQTTVPSSGTYTMTPTRCQGSEGSTAGVTKSFSSNLTADNYIYVAVPCGWTVTTMECKSAVTAVKIAVSQKATAATDDAYNIYVTTSTVRNISGNQIFVQSGKGSIE